MHPDHRPDEGPDPTAPGTSPARPDPPPGAAGPGYAGEWSLFCDYTAAVDQPALPTTVTALTGFLTALPAHPATVARRVRAIAAAHRRAGHLLDRPDTGPAAAPAPGSRPPRSPDRPDPGRMIAACATRGWPAGLPGRRDAFLVVLVEVLGHTRPAARRLSPADIDIPAGGPYDAAGPSIGGRVVPDDGDPRRCPACAVVRWLDVLGVADGLGRGSARMTLTAAHAPTRSSPHQHTPTAPSRWRCTVVLLPAIDQHGWHDDYRPMTARAIRTRLALAVRRTDSDTAPNEQPAPAAGTTGAPGPVSPAAAPEPVAPDLGEVLGLLDDLADDADALNARIQALLADTGT